MSDDAICGDPYLVTATDSTGERATLLYRCQRLRPHGGKHCAPYLGSYMFWWDGPSPASPEEKP